MAIRSRWVPVLCAVFAAWQAVAQQTPGTNPATLDDLSARVRREVDAGRDSPQLTSLLRQRAIELRALALRDPSRALSALFSESERTQVRRIRPNLGFDVEQAGEWDGVARIVVADDFERGRSETHAWLDQVGRRTRLAIAGAMPRAGDQVHVRGVAIGDVILTDSLVMAAPIAPAAGSTCTTGSQSVLVVLVNFAGQALSAAVNQQTLSGYVFGTSGHSVNLYWQEASSGLTSASGIVYPTPVTMDATITSDTQYSAIENQVRATIPAATYNSYSHHVLIIPKTADIGWAGLGEIGPCAQTLWIPDLYASSGDQTIEIIAHELGHNLGLEHAATQQFGSQTLGPPYDPANATNQTGHVDYGDYTSVMGIAQGYLGHYAAPHKLQLGWLQLGTDVQQVQANGTFTLQPLEVSSGLRALKVQRGAGLNQWVWLQFRQNFGFDGLYSNPWTHAWDGVSMYLDDPANWSGYTLLLDFTASTTAGNFSDAPLTAGKTWSDPYSPLTIAVNSANASGASVTVQYDTSCATLGATSAQLPTAGGTGQITVNAAANCSWTANPNVSWITLTGVTSGSGSGVVPYQVTANPNSAPRTGTISVARQFYSITESGTAGATTTTLQSSLNPSTSGQAVTFTATISSGTAGTITGTVQFLDGATSIGSAAISLGKATLGTSALAAGSHSITAQYFGNASFLGSTSSALTQVVNSLLVSAPAFSPAAGTYALAPAVTISSATAGASIRYTLDGSTPTPTIGTVYSTPVAIAATATLKAIAFKAGLTDSSVTTGAFTVLPSCVATLTPVSRSFSLAAGASNVAVSAGAGCNWTATTDSPAWITFAGGAGNGNGTFSFNVAANAGLTRLGTVTVGSQAFKVMQDGPTVTFNDVPANAAYFNYISLMASNGITAGCSANPPLYCASTPVTRAQMSVFMVAGLNKALNTTLTYTPAPYFDDMQPASNFFPFVQRIRDLNITAGCSVTPALFCPDTSITHGQMAVFVIASWMVANNLSSFANTTTPYFTDVPSTHPFFKFIQKMRDLGFWTGCTATTYCESTPVTRGQMAPMIMRSLLAAP